MGPNDRQRLIDWVAAEITPHEAAIRAWLTRAMVAPDDRDDLIQEAYCHITELPSFDHIERPAAFFFRIVRNLLISQLRHNRVVNIEAVSEIGAIAGMDEAPTPERIADGRREYHRVRQAIAELPERCRVIFELRKIEGLSQKDIARRLGITETIVENEGARGLRLIIEALRRQGEQIAEHYTSLRERKRARRS